MIRLTYKRATFVLALLLVAAVWDDVRRIRSSAAPAASAAAQAVATAAPSTRDHGTEQVTTELQCPDGAKWTQTSSRHASSSVTAPVSVGVSTATGAEPGRPGDNLGAYTPPRYSASADVNPLRPHDIGVYLSMRLGDLPLSIVVGGQVRGGVPEPRIGIRVDL